MKFRTEFESHAFKKSVIAVATTLTFFGAHADTPYTVVDTTSVGASNTNNIMLRDLSPGGGTVAVQVMGQGGIVSTGRLNIQTGVFTPFSLTALGVNDPTRDNAWLMGTTIGGQYIYQLSSTDANHNYVSSAIGLLSSNGQTLTRLTYPAVSGYDQVDGYFYSNQPIDKYMPLNTWYYDSTNSLPGIDKSYVYNIVDSSTAEVAPITSGNYVNLAWVKTDDGTMALGAERTNTSGAYGTSIPIKWTPSAGTQQLFTLPAGFHNVNIRDASSDGSVVVGALNATQSTVSGSTSYWYQTGSGFVWKSSVGLTQYDPDSGYNNLSINKIAGTDKYYGYQYFQATSSGGSSSIQPMAFVLEGGVKTDATTYFGVNNYTLSYLSSYSADGSVILARACPTGGCTTPNSSVYLLLGVPTRDAVSAPVISLNDVAPQLVATAATVETATTATSTLINGAHSNPMLHLLEKGEKAFWVTGDLGSDDHGYRSGSFGLGEMNLGYNYGNFQVNYSLGRAFAVQKLDFGGDIRTLGNFANVEAIIPIKNLENRYLTVGAFSLRGDSTAVRGYDNNGQVDSSSGTTKAKATGLRARVDWLGAANFKGATVSPYADFSRVQTDVDGYTEVGGGFPATFGERKDTFTEVRIGANASMPFKGNVTLLGNVEVAHRNKDAGPASVGSISGIDFNLPGNTFKQTWAKAGAGFEASIKKNHKVSVMLNATTQGPASNAWLSASYQASF